MNAALDDVARRLDLAAAHHERLRLAFGSACVLRVRHLLEDPAIVDCLDALRGYLDGTVGREALRSVAVRAAGLANRHPGSPSIDGCGHAAVSASYAVAKALEGRALDAAGYAAYATVYAQGGAAAVADRDAFEPESAWQVAALEALSRQDAPV